MNLPKISKQDIMNNLYNIFLCILYAIILALVYSTWIIKTSNIIWLVVLLTIIFIIAGIIIAYIWTVKHKQFLENRNKDIVN